jgi:hypothetical protein
MVLFFAELVLKGLPEQPDGARIGLGIDHVPGTRICFFTLPGYVGFQRSVYILFSGMKTGIMARINNISTGAINKKCHRISHEETSLKKLCKRDFPDHSAHFS